MRLRGVDRLEEAGAFQHDIHAHVAMRQLARLTLAGDGDLLAIDHQRIAIHADRTGEAAVGRIELEQQRVGVRIGKIVDRHQFEIVIVPFQQRARDEPPDPAETIDCNLGRHDDFLLTYASSLARILGTIASLVNPKCSNASGAGADVPKPSMPMRRPLSMV